MEVLNHKEELIKLFTDMEEDNVIEYFYYLITGILKAEE